MRTRLRRTASCTQNSRCFPSPSGHPIDFAAAESVMLSMGISQPSSSNTAFTPNASAALRASAFCSTSLTQRLESNSTTSRASLPQSASLRRSTCGTSCIQPSNRCRRRSASTTMESHFHLNLLSNDMSLSSFAPLPRTFIWHQASISCVIHCKPCRGSTSVKSSP